MIETPFSIAGPSTGWISGFPFHASAWTGSAELGGTAWCFSALNSPGELAAAGTSPAWSFNLKLTSAFTNPTCYLLCNGFVMLSDVGEETAPIACVMMEDGLMVGVAPADVLPVLFSSSGEVEGVEAQSIHRDEQQQTVLRWQTVGGLMRFCLVTGEAGDSLLSARAEAALEQDVYELMRHEWDLRNAYYQRFPFATDHPQNALAIECLAGRLRIPSGNLSQRWMADSLLTDAVILEDWFPAFLAWMELDDRVALDLFLSLLEHQDASGLLVWYQADDEDGFAPRPWTFLGKCLALLHQRETDPERIASLVDAVANHLGSVVRYVDPQRQGQPRWPDAEDSFIPELWGEDVRSVDLAALLLADLEALNTTAESLSITSPALAELIDYRELLSRYLLTDLWSVEKECFQSYLTQGQPVSRASLGDLFPLSWSALPQLQREALARVLRRKTGLMQDGLPADWEAWPQDEEAAPLNPGHLTVLLEALDDPLTEDALQSLIFHLRERITLLYEKDLILPEEWSLVSENPTEEEPSRRMLDAGAASLLLCMNARLERQDQVYANFPRVVRWIDQHRISFTLGMALVMVLPILSIVLYFNTKASLTVKDSYALSGLAQHMHRAGDHNRAIEMFEDLIEVTAQEKLTANYKLQLANAYFAEKNFEKSEALYLELLEGEEPLPIAQWNLAQTYIRMRQYDEATKRFEQFIVNFGERFPSLVERAKHAKELISSQQVLQRGRPPFRKDKKDRAVHAKEV